MGANSHYEGCRKDNQGDDGQRERGELGGDSCGADDNNNNVKKVCQNIAQCHGNPIRVQ